MLLYSSTRQQPAALLTLKYKLCSFSGSIEVNAIEIHKITWVEQGLWQKPVVTSGLCWDFSSWDTEPIVQNLPMDIFAEN